MKARPQAFPLIAILGLFLTGQPALQAQRSPKTEAKHCLWRVQGPSSTVYLLGSMHFLKKEFYPLAKPIEDAYSNSPIVVFEADLQEMQSPAAQTKMANAGKYADGQPLPQNISKKPYDKLQSYLAEAVGSGSAFDSLKPWMAAVALSEIELQRLGFDPEHGIDNYFFRRTRQDKKQTQGLETMDFQLSLFTSLSSEDQEAMIKEALDDIAASRKILSELADAWQVGDTKQLDKLMLETMRDYPQLNKKLLLDRNQRWIPKIEKLLASETHALIIVGTAHLIGKESVVDLLSKKGF